MNYLPFALIAPILTAVANIIQKVVVSDNKIHGGIFAGTFGLLVALLTTPFALGTERLTPEMFSTNVLFSLLLMMSLYSMAMLGFFTAMKHVPISEIIFLESATPIFVLFGSVLFLAESMTWNKLLGAMLVIVGILVAFHYKGTNRWTKFHTLGLISGILYAGAYMTDKYLLTFIPTLSYLILSFGLPSIALLFIFRRKLNELHYFLVNKKARNIIWSSIFAALGFYTLFQAYRLSDEISLVNPIFETKALWVVALGIIFLKERKNMLRKIIGISLAVAGILLVNL